MILKENFDKKNLTDNIEYLINLYEEQINELLYWIEFDLEEEEPLYTPTVSVECGVGVTISVNHPSDYPKIMKTLEGYDKLFKEKDIEIVETAGGDIILKRSD